MTLSQYVIYLLSAILMNSTIIISAGIVLKEQIKINKRNIIILLLQSCIMVLNNYYTLISIRYIMSIILSILLIKFIFNIKFEKALIFTLLNAIISIIVELLTSIVLINITDISVLNDQIFIKFIFSIVNSFIIMFVITNKKVTSLIHSVYKIVDKNKVIFRYLIAVIIILNIILFLRGLNMQNKSILLIVTLLTFLIVFILRNMIHDKYNIQILEDRNNNLNNLFKANSKTIDQCRELKHNLKNDLYFLKSSIPCEYHKEINELIIKYNKNYDWINQIDNIPEGLQGIIFLKNQEAKKHKINMRISYNKTSKSNSKDYLDLSSILGILLDNAIEASKRKRNSVIEVNLKETKDEIRVSIINCFKNTVDLNKIGKKNYSTKKYKSGIGLDYISRIKNNNIKVNFKIVNNLFISKIVYIQN